MPGSIRSLVEVAVEVELRRREKLGLVRWQWGTFWVESGFHHR